jgi:hypothetical protein
LLISTRMMNLNRLKHFTNIIMGNHSIFSHSVVEVLGISDVLLF